MNVITVLLNLLARLHPCVATGGWFRTADPFHFARGQRLDSSWIAFSSKADASESDSDSVSSGLYFSNSSMGIFLRATQLGSSVNHTGTIAEFRERSFTAMRTGESDLQRTGFLRHSSGGYLRVTAGKYNLVK